MNPESNLPAHAGGRTIIYRKIETCPRCGAWDPFRKAGGRSTVDRNTGLRRIYGECRRCGAKMIVQYVLDL